MYKIKIPFYFLSYKGSPQTQNGDLSNNRAPSAGNEILCCPKAAGVFPMLNNNWDFHCYLNPLKLVNALCIEDKYKEKDWLEERDFGENHCENRRKLNFRWHWSKSNLYSSNFYPLVLAPLMILAWINYYDEDRRYFYLHYRFQSTWIIC